MLTLPFLALALGLVPSVQACAVHNGARVKARAAHDNTEELARITARQQPPVGNGRTAITNVQIFNGNGLSVPSTVILTGEFITQIGPSALTPVIGATIIDGQGGVLLPGLIDNHCHPERLSDITNSTSWGVTTAIGMACLSYSSCNALKNLNGLTSFITTGIPATGPGSPHQVLLGFPLSETISSPEQAPQFVANVFGNGSAFLKMVAEQGGLDQATLNALVEYTHQAGHVSTTHATTNATYWQAIQSQVDSIQHVPIDMPLSTAAAQQILQQRQFVTPTLNIFPYLLGIPGGLPGGTPPGSQYANAAESAKTLYVTGVPILVGTDSFEDPDNPLLAIPFGSSLHHELELLVQAGLNPVDVLNGATSLAAKYHNLRDRGSVTVGLRADLTLIQGNPLTNISNTRNIKQVFVGGIRYTGPLAGTQPVGP